MITITCQTKISEIIKANSSAIDELARLAKPFSKLRNPVLRRIMTPRMTLAGAAKVGNCSVKDIADVLFPLGFEYKQLKEVEGKQHEHKPDWLRLLNSNEIFKLDVRPVLESGESPMKDIMTQFKRLRVGEVLCVVNSFEPIPLIELFERDNRAKVYVEFIRDFEYHIFFLKLKPKNEIPKKERFTFQQADEFYKLLDEYSEGEVVRLDVRKYEMPLPMQMILEALVNLKTKQVLYVQHNRVPVFLLEELTEKSVCVYIHEIEDGNVKMLFIPESKDV